MAQKVTDSTHSLNSLKLDEALRNYYRNSGKSVSDVFDIAAEEANKAVRAVLNTTQPRRQRLFHRFFGLFKSKS